MFWKRVIVDDHERVLIVKNDRLTKILARGDHWIFVAPGVSLEIERHDVHNLEFQSRWVNYLVKERPDLVEDYFTRVETNEVQVAMVYVEGKLFRVLTPAKNALFWRGLAEVTAEVVEVVAEAELPVDMFLELERDR